ncbi:MAG: glycoside hydrolase family 32 protein [Bacteroidetes bacterium]|nr:glycoside hydrolase family 32 protein [Bacteroidota bacterium]
MPELVDGVSGGGIRTDGYSTYLSLSLGHKTTADFKLGAYFALETYPTDTAGFLTVYGKEKGDWVAACVDKFGQPMLAVCKKNICSWFPVNAKLDKFRWINVGVNITRSNAELIINGVTQKTVPLQDDLFATIDSLNIGRDGRLKRIGIFPVNYINGIIDRVELTNKSGNAINTAEINKYLKKTPRLAIPASRFAGDFSRPAYHLLPAANWTNETHGLIYYDGLYHIFNQKNGANLFLGQINWGHFTSPDLLHWTEQKPVLTPEAGYDEKGIWSGCCFLDSQNKAAIVYSSSGPASFDICLARPDNAALLKWTKFKDNPIISSPPPGSTRNDFHDPYVWKSGKSFYMIVGMGLTQDGVNKGTVLLYNSADLVNWSYLHPLFIGDPVHDDSGVFWEMPVFYQFGDKYLLLVNKVPERTKPAVALYWTGRFVDEYFVPDEKKPRKLEVINRLLSPSVTKDASGQTVAIGIIPDETSASATYRVGWTHLFSIPRVWTLTDGKICQEPDPVLRSLRERETRLSRQNVGSNDTLLISNGKHQLELSVDIIPGDCKQFGFIVGKDPAGKEFSKIYFDIDKGQLVVDQTKSSLSKNIPLRVRTGEYRVTPGQKVNIHLFFDGSVIEGFINHQDAFTTRLFPEKPESTRIEFFANGGAVTLLDATLWSIRSTNIKTNF